MGRTRGARRLTTTRERAVLEEGKTAGELFQAEFDRTGGRQRKLPASPHQDSSLSAIWQAGFDSTSEAARLEMTCADCGEELEGYEEQVCTDCLEKFEES